MKDDSPENLNAPTEYLTLGEVRSILKISKPTLLRIIRSGQIPACKAGGQWRIAKSRLEEWLEKDALQGQVCERQDKR